MDTLTNFLVASSWYPAIGAGHQELVLSTARVKEVDARLRDGAAGKRRLRPEEWVGGKHWRLVDIVGSPQALAGALANVAAGPLAGKIVHVRQPGAGGYTFTTLDKVMAAASSGAASTS